MKSLDNSSSQNHTEGEGHIYTTLLVQFCDLVAPPAKTMRFTNLSGCLL